MKIGIIYDLKDDYSIETVESEDFTQLEEVILLSNFLIELEHNVELIHGIAFLLDNIKKIKNTYDLIINMTEGCASRNREALVPALLELYGIPYIGSDCYANNVTLDKHLTKLIARECNIPTPSFSIFIQKENIFLNTLPTSNQVVLKPVYGGASDGITLLKKNNPDLLSIIKNLSKKFEQNILIEEYVSGCDFSVSMYGNADYGYKIIGGVEILDKSSNSLTVYDRKYKKNFDVLKIAPRWTSSTRDQIYQMCQKMSMIINLSGFFRFDFKVDGENINFLEINSVPSLLSKGSFIKAIELNNQNKKEVFRGIIEYGVKFIWSRSDL